MSLEQYNQAQARNAWRMELRINRRHRKDLPGIHLDVGTYVDQLRYHDRGGVLRGVLRLHHKPAKKAAYAHSWDEPHEPGFLWVAVDPLTLRQGIGLALLQEAMTKRKWTIDFDRQQYTPAGFRLISKMRRLIRDGKRRADDSIPEEQNGA